MNAVSKKNSPLQQQAQEKDAKVYREQRELQELRVSSCDLLLQIFFFSNFSQFILAQQGSLSTIYYNFWKWKDGDHSLIEKMYVSSQ